MVRWCTLPRLLMRATVLEGRGGGWPAVMGRRRKESSWVSICNHNVKVLAAADNSVWGSGSTVARTLAVTALRFSPVVTDNWLRLGLGHALVAPASLRFLDQQVAQQLLQVGVLDPHCEGEPHHRAKDASAGGKGPVQPVFHGGERYS
jgi:hypothetical protein